MEVIKPNEKQLDHISQIIKQNEMILNVNRDIIKMVTMPPIVMLDPVSDMTRLKDAES